ncbi:MAG: DUF359 domain-containing protein [Candidatus Thorarchaeota archaeon]|nr:DUF359 domain-containing protein [Candidatus Thorarchaeota archaeon]
MQTATWALNLFDRLHLGHHVLIERLSEMPNPSACVLDGPLIDSELELRAIVQPADIRVARLQAFLRDEGLSETVAVSLINDIDQLTRAESRTRFMMFEGPCCAEIQAGVLERWSGVRDARDAFELLKPVRASDGDKLSSARIRKGEIDRLGRRLKGTREPARRLEVQDRAYLQAPKGRLYHTRDGPPEVQVASELVKTSPPRVIAVGDVTSATLAAQGAHVDLSIVDGATKRGAFSGRPTSECEYHIYNPPAVIYPEAWSTIDTALDSREKSVILVDGEEDLLGFPVVLLAPEGSVMLYGQPDAGIVWVPVNRENKSLARALLERMPTVA